MPTANSRFRPEKLFDGTAKMRAMLRRNKRRRVKERKRPNAQRRNYLRALHHLDKLVQSLGGKLHVLTP
jgi:hypothetical protein